jgi:hypothetical protein
MLGPHSNKLPHLVVYTDNQNTVYIWHILKASVPYNSTLITAINNLITSQTDAHVLHVSGVDNTITDALSCFNNSLALCLVPGIKAGLLEPSCSMLGALKK